MKTKAFCDKIENKGGHDCGKQEDVLQAGSNDGRETEQHSRIYPMSELAVLTICNQAVAKKSLCWKMTWLVERRIYLHGRLI